MPSAKVIVVGCGIAGPVLAVFLKLKGYDPIIYERLEASGDAGLSIMLQTNGLKVLSLIPGLVQSLPGKAIDRLAFYSVLPEDLGLLAEINIPQSLREKYNFSMMGIERSKLLQVLVDTAQKHGVPVVRGHKLVSLEQDDNEVRVTFENGATDTASFVVGCDGLHSNTRACLFGRENADFTGLTQMGGISLNPKSLNQSPTMTNVYGNKVHMISYQISDTHHSWAITQREEETKETWRSLDTNVQESIKSGPFSALEFGAGEIVKNSQRIVKYGLYDRPELQTWYKQRVVLLGDAAHPTSPHLGQGANQAFEDIYHLVRLLVKQNPDANPPSMSTLKVIFDEYERIRIPRTTMLVKGARNMGEMRVIEGVDNCVARNAAVKAMWAEQEPEKLVTSYKSNLEEPFSGQSEI